MSRVALNKTSSSQMRLFISGKALKKTKRAWGSRQNQPARSESFLAKIVQYWTEIYPEPSDH
jgi:hypothetical protein